MSATAFSPSPTVGLSPPVATPIVTVRMEHAGDVSSREALLDRVMGPSRRRKSSEAIRRGRRPAAGLSLIAADESGRLVGTVRLWNIVAGGDGVPSLLLGPLAVADELRGAGLGSALMRRAVAEARWQGHRSIVLMGDPGYYDRFGFLAETASGLTMPGPFERHRLLALELEEAALAGASGLIRPTGQPISASRLRHGH